MDDIKLNSNSPTSRLPSQEGLARECVEGSDILNAFITPRLLKANRDNGIGRLHTVSKKDPFGKYFEESEITREPHAGDTHLVALRTFRQYARKGGYEGKHHR